MKYPMYSRFLIFCLSATAFKTGNFLKTYEELTCRHQVMLVQVFAYMEYVRICSIPLQIVV
jgi:hypothetical protein